MLIIIIINIYNNSKYKSPYSTGIVDPHSLATVTKNIQSPLTKNLAQMVSPPPFKKPKLLNNYQINMICDNKLHNYGNN